TRGDRKRDALALGRRDCQGLRRFDLARGAGESGHPLTGSSRPPGGAAAGPDAISRLAGVEATELVRESAAEVLEGQQRLVDKASRLLTGREDIGLHLRVGARWGAGRNDLGLDRNRAAHVLGSANDDHGSSVFPCFVRKEVAVAILPRQRVI